MCNPPNHEIYSPTQPCQTDSSLQNCKFLFPSSPNLPFSNTVSHGCSGFVRWVWYYTWNYTKNEDFKQHSLASFQRYIVSTQWVECSLYIVVCHGDSVSAALCSHLEHRLQTERFRGLYQSFGGCRAFLGRFPPWLEWTVFQIEIRLPGVKIILAITSRL